MLSDMIPLTKEELVKQENWSVIRGRDHGSLESGSSRQRLRLKSVPCLEDPPHRRQAYSQKADRHGQAHADAHIGDPVEAPAETADQVDDRVEESGRLPERRQHVDGVEATAEEDQ